MARLVLAGLLAFMALLVVPMPQAEAQQFQGNEPGGFQQFQRFQPDAVPFGGDQTVTCARQSDVARIGRRTCVYQCDNGSLVTRNFGRSSVC